jgi:diguanylate cyclase (GGDEF)-like protein
MRDDEPAVLCPVRGAGRITVVCGGIVIAAAWAVTATGVASPYLAVTRVLAELLVAPAVALAWRFRRHRLAIAAVLIAAANYLLRDSVGGSGDVDLSRPLLGVMVPLNLGLLGLVADRPLRSVAMLIHLGLVTVQITALAYLQGAGLPASAFVTAPWIKLLEAPQATLLAILMAATFVLLAFALRRASFEASLLWVLVGWGLAIAGAGASERESLLLACAQLVLLVGLIEDTYRLAYHDELTGLPGRRALEEALRELTGEFAIAMVDIDHFKRFNDRHGHDVGDQALRMVADRLLIVSGGGRAYRYGGEEFAVLFPGRSPDQAHEHLERLRREIFTRRFAIRSPSRPRRKPEHPRAPKNPPRRITLTVSIGLAGSTPRRTRPGEVMKAADQALYRAKRAGRNRLSVAK